MKRFLLYTITATIASALVLAVVIISYSNTTYQKADSAIVLGAAVWNDVPSPVFQARIDHAIALYKSGDIQNIYFTGGSSEGEVSEGEVAKHYARTQGVKPEDIAIETYSKTTFQNLKNIATQIEPGTSVLIITDPLHEFRSVHMARYLGMNAYPSPTPFTRYVSLKTNVPFLLREVYFTFVYLIFKM
jgi:uncharacterized SAM-binding protein YcdF (DUF218 family)